MVDFVDLFAPNTHDLPTAFGNAGCWEATISRIDSRGLFVIVTAYDRKLEWGPVLPERNWLQEGVRAQVGERVAIIMSNARRPWLLTSRPGWEHEVWDRLRRLEQKVADLEFRVDWLAERAHTH
jgi:hypothetical protein